MATRIGPLASQSCKPRQTRKGAAVVAEASAGVWLVRGAATLVYRTVDGLLALHS